LLLSLPIAADWRLRLPFLVAAGFSTVAWVLVLTRLPESRPAGSKPPEPARVASWRGIADTIAIPGVGRLVSIGFLSVLAFAAYEGTIALFLLRRFQWQPRTAAFAFAGLGLVTAVVQGGLIRRLVPKFGEARLIVAGLGLVASALAGLAIVSKAPELALTLLMLGVGQGLVSPSVSGLISRITPMSEQGAVFGTVSSTQTLARMISYSVSNILLDQVSTGAPFWTAFGVDLIALALAVPLVARAGDPEPLTAGVTDLPS
jgi:MFS transporter, DHA1 family, tetracycline resistance protein